MVKFFTMKKRVGLLLACALGGCAALSFGLYNTGVKASAAELDHGAHSGWTEIAANITGSESAEAPARYYLSADFTANTTIVIESGYVELCLAGNVFTGDGQNAVFQVNSGATLTLCDCDDSKQHYYTQADKAAYVFAGVTSETSTTYVSGGVITGGKCGVEVLAGGTFIMNGGTIAGNSGADDGAGVTVRPDGATFTMNGGAIRGNKANWRGAGIYVSNENATTDAVSKATMNGGVICDNQAWRSENKYGNGGGVAVVHGGEFTMTSGEIKNNNSAYDRNIEVDSATFKMTGGSIVDPYATTEDMVPSVTAYGDVTIKGGTIDGYIYRGNWTLKIEGGYYNLTKFRPGLGTLPKITGGYFSTDLSQLYVLEKSGNIDVVSQTVTAADYIPDTHQLVALSDEQNYGDGDYNSEYPYAVYEKQATSFSIEALTASYGSTLAPVVTGNEHEAAVSYTYLPKTDGEGTESATPVEGLPAAVGSYTVTATFAEKVDGANKKVYAGGTAEFDVTINKATAVAEEKPAETIEVKVGKTLSEIELPEGWAWEDGSVVLNEKGEYTFTAIYTPADTDNYVPLTMSVKLVVSANGLPGWGIALIVIGCLAVAGGAGFAVYYFLFRGKKKGAE